MATPHLFGGLGRRQPAQTAGALVAGRMGVPSRRTAQKSGSKSARAALRAKSLLQPKCPAGTFRAAAVAWGGEDIAGAEIRDQPTPAIGANGQGMASGQGLDIGVESVRLRHAAEQEEPYMPSWVGIAVPGMSAGAQGLDR